MTLYSPMRRVPQAYSRGYLLRRLSRARRPIVRAIGAAVLAEILPAPRPVRTYLRERSQWITQQAVEALQRIYFDTPGLDAITIREVAKTGLLISRAVRARLAARIIFGRDPDGTNRRNLQLLPRLGYDSLMATGLALGTAAGVFTGGGISTHMWWSSDDPTIRVPSGHPIPAARRFEAPQTLTDLAADIDDLYWAGAYGQAIKVTRVGQGPQRRWLVSLPGTDHTSLHSQPNAADVESNMMEQLNLDSPMRRGTIAVINAAMEAEGVPADQRQFERVLICGHSQGGMIAAALASLDPAEVGFNVDRVLTLGSPTRRLRLRPDVQMLAVEHIQDIVPSMDGSPRKVPDQRVVARRRLTRPRVGPLLYAHSSSTYTETLHMMERRQGIVQWGRATEVLSELQKYLPQAGESTHVAHYYTWQEVLPPHRSKALDQYPFTQSAAWQPVEFGGEVQVHSFVTPQSPQQLMQKLRRREDQAAAEPQPDTEGDDNA